MTHKSESIPFKPRARLLLLLGDQLIRDPQIAVFELVKNAYDADSPDVTVGMSNLKDKDRAAIVVEDAGTGMDWDTVTNVWLEPGTDYRMRQKEKGTRTPKFGRLPLGEKGVGRFAAHKLGQHVALITRKKGHPEVVVKVEWEQFEEEKYLEKVPVSVSEREPRIFTGSNTGTRIEIRKLRDAWTRGAARDLARSITSICSPFDEHGAFKPRLVLTDNKEWLEGIISIDEVKDYALFRATCLIKDNKFKYDYRFNPYPGMDRVKSRETHVSDKNLMFGSSGNEKGSIDLEAYDIGPVRIDLYIYDREPSTLSLGVSDKKGLKEFLDKVGGVRVYRDGIRVYDYGEPGNDWLDLGGRRVNVPTRRLSNNLVIGAVSLRLDRSGDLIEKTNREGFVENIAFRRFQAAVSNVIDQITAERNIDKRRIRNAYSGPVREPVTEDLAELRRIIEAKKLTKELGGYLDRIESDFLMIRDRFLTSASAGLSLTVVIHEVEKGIAELVRAVEKENASVRVKKLAKHIADLIEGFGALARRTGSSAEKASEMIRQAVFNTELRLKAHKVAMTLDIGDADFEVKCSRRLIVSTIMNIIDNSIWWLDNKWGIEAVEKKQVYLGISNELSHGPAIVIADNGPGFQDSPEYLIEPFITRKPDGMGLGLHIADQVMKTQGGKLEFPQRGDVALPKRFSGAMVALVFGGAKWLD